MFFSAKESFMKSILGSDGELFCAMACSPEMIGKFSTQVIVLLGQAYQRLIQ